MEKLKEEWQQFVESQVWQGEDEFTKNMGVGNVADWWLSKIDELLKQQREEMFWKGYEKGVDIQMEKGVLTDEEIDKLSAIINQ